MQKFKIALFGTGFVGRVHLEGIRRLGYVELYAIGEPQIEKANQLADEFGVTHTEADYHRILEDPAVDAVHICTPNALHFPIAKDALLAGNPRRDQRCFFLKFAGGCFISQELGLWIPAERANEA